MYGDEGSKNKIEKFRDALYDFAHTDTERVNLVSFPKVFEGFPIPMGEVVPTTQDALHPKKLANMINANIRPLIEM